MNEFLADTDFLQTFGPFFAAFLLLFFFAWAAIDTFSGRRREAKKIALPHTMSEAEYVRLNEKRTKE